MKGVQKIFKIQEVKKEIETLNQKAIENLDA